MLNTLRQIKIAFQHALAIPGRFIATCDTLADALKANTATLEALRNDLGTLSADGELHHQELCKHVRYLATSEQQKLKREGRAHQFS